MDYILTMLGVPCYLMLLTTWLPQGSGCGDHIDTRKKKVPHSGVVTSPGFPMGYPNFTHCVWLMEGERDTAFNITVHTLDVTPEYSHCNDYIEIRAGSSKAKLLYKGCNATTPFTMTSPYQWLWVRFRSRFAAFGMGFNASWKRIYNPVGIRPQIPILNCPVTRVSCRNKECISLSWVCDGYNDCGCDYCDESGCDPLFATKLKGVLIGLSVGFIIFIVSVVVAMYYDYGVLCGCRRPVRSLEDLRYDVYSGEQSSYPGGYPGEYPGGYMESPQDYDEDDNAECMEPLPADADVHDVDIVDIHIPTFTIDDPVV